MLSKIQKSEKQTYFLFYISSPVFCLLTFKLFVLLCWGVGRACTHLWKLSLFLHHAGTRDYTQAVSLGGEHLYSLSCTSITSSNTGKAKQNRTTSDVWSFLNKTRKH